MCDVNQAPPAMAGRIAFKGKPRAEWTTLTRAAEADIMTFLKMSQHMCEGVEEGLPRYWTSMYSATVLGSTHVHLCPTPAPDSWA